MEWKFVRAELYMEFIEPGSTLPMPFNIFPSLKSLGRLFYKCYLCCSSQRMNRQDQDGSDIEMTDKEAEIAEDEMRKELQEMGKQETNEQDYQTETESKKKNKSKPVL